MLVFIDDSGDAGFKLNRGSTRFFVISAVIFDDNLEAEKAAIAIKETRRALGYPDFVEFKFNKSRKKIRTVFLKAINKYDFRIRCLVVDKQLIRSDELKNNRNSFYSYMIKTLLKYSNDTILDASIKIDGGGDRTFRRSFITYLRKQLNSKESHVIKNCKLVNSKNNQLIQMADMVAGSIRRSYTDKLDSKIYKKIISKHIQDEWPFK